MVLKSFDRKDDNEGRYITFIFEDKHWQQRLIYTGDIVMQDPMTIADSTTFVLVGGVTWTGTAGSSITFKVHDANTLTEVSRVQAD